MFSNEESPKDVVRVSHGLSCPSSQAEVRHARQQREALQKQQEEEARAKLQRQETERAEAKKRQEEEERAKRQREEKLQEEVERAKQLRESEQRRQALEKDLRSREMRLGLATKEVCGSGSSARGPSDRRSLTANGRRLMANFSFI